MVSNGRNESNWHKYFKAARAGLICCGLVFVCGSIRAETQNQVVGGNQTNSTVKYQTNTRQAQPDSSKPVTFQQSIQKNQESRELTEKQTGQDAEENNGFWNGKFTDWAIVGLTFGLLVVGAIQAYVYCRQAGLMRAALKETRRSNIISSRVAKISERTLIDLERPYIFVSGVVNILNREVEGNEYPVVLCDVSNHGRLPAVIKKCEYMFGWGKSTTNQFEAPEVIAADAKHKNAEIDADVIRCFLKGVRDGDDISSYYYECWIPTDDVIASAPPLSLRILIHYDGPFTKGHETSSYWTMKLTAGALDSRPITITPT